MKRGELRYEHWNEFASAARKWLQMDWPWVQRSIEQTLVCCPGPRPVTIQTHWLAQKICARHGFEIYDGLILASAHEAGCSVLYSQDMQDGQVIEGVWIVNPFL